MFSSMHGRSEGVKQIVICRNERKYSSVAIMVLQMPNFLNVKVREVIFYKDIGYNA